MRSQAPQMSVNDCMSWFRASICCPLMSPSRSSRCTCCDIKAATWFGRCLAMSICDCMSLGKSSNSSTRVASLCRWFFSTVAYIGMVWRKNARLLCSAGSMADSFMAKLRLVLVSAPHSFRPSHQRSYAVLVRKTSKKEMTNPKRVCMTGMLRTWLFSLSCQISNSNQAINPE
jgi:hypothetical protein